MENNPVTDTVQTNSAEDLLVREDYKRIIENLLFITDRPLSIAKISQVAEVNNIQLTREIVGQLQQEFPVPGEEEKKKWISWFEQNGKEEGKRVVLEH